MPVKACVILGAGASLDVQGPSSLGLRRLNNIEFNPRYKPALAKNLFQMSERAHDHFELAISKYPGAEYLAQRLGIRATIQKDDFDIEAELRNMANDPDPLIHELYKHVPPYLRDLLALSSYHWTPLATHYAELVTVLLSENHLDVLFLVLNYDTLLETVLTRYNPAWAFASINDYVRQDRKAKVVKLHGSVDWFKLIGSDSTGATWDELVAKTEVLVKPPDEDIHVRNFRSFDPSKDIVRAHSINGQWVYPILTAPLAGKGPKDMVCPDSHDQAAREFLSDCQRFLVIGTAGHDVDLLELLDDEVHADTDCVLHFVGKLPEVDAALERFRDHVTAFGIASTRTYGDGFKEYVRHKGLEEFARECVEDQPQ